MKYRLLDLLACPVCKEFPLKLTVYEIREYPERKFRISKCELYCGYLNKEIMEISETPCNDCIKYEVVGGLLECRGCGNWYPIYEEIPVMLVGELRDRNIEKKFAERYKDKIPKKVLSEILGQK